MITTLKLISAVAAAGFFVSMFAGNFGADFVLAIAACLS
jgi:hypothetical protein